MNNQQYTMITTVQMNLKNEKSYLFLYQHDKKKKNEFKIE